MEGTPIPIRRPRRNFLRFFFLSFLGSHIFFIFVIFFSPPHIVPCFGGVTSRTGKKETSFQLDTPRWSAQVRPQDGVIGSLSANQFYGNRLGWMRSGGGGEGEQTEEESVATFNRSERTLVAFFFFTRFASVSVALFLFQLTNGSGRWCRVGSVGGIENQLIHR